MKKYFVIVQIAIIVKINSFNQKDKIIKNSKINWCKKYIIL